MIKIRLYVGCNGLWCENRKGKLEYIKDIKFIIEKIKRKAVDIVLLKEDIFVENIETETKDEEKFVKEYIYERFGDRDDILYNYVFEYKNKRKLITIYLINTSSLDQLKDFISMFKIKSIWPIQIHYLKGVKKSYKNFNMFIEERDKIYYVDVNNRKLIATKIVDTKCIRYLLEDSYYIKGKNAFVYGSDELLNALSEGNLYDKVLKIGEGLYEI